MPKLSIDTRALVTGISPGEVAYQIYGWPTESSEAGAVFIGSVLYAGITDFDGHAVIDVAPSLVDADGDAITWLVILLPAYNASWPFIMPNTDANFGYVDT